MADSPKKPEDETDPVALTKTVISGSLGSLALALVASVLMGMIFRGWIALTGHNIPDWVFTVSWLAVFGGIVLGDPLSTWREGKSKTVIALKMAGGMALGTGIYLIVHFQEVFMEKESPYAAFWLILPMVIVMPILFGSFATKRFLENKATPLPKRTWDAAIEYLDTAGPIVMMAVMGIAFLFYWLVSPSLDITLILMFVILCGIVGYCAVIYDGSLSPITDETEELPRSKTLREALWKNLDVATSMLPAALYMGGMLWVMLAVFAWANGGKSAIVAKDGDIELVSLLLSLGWMTGVAIGVFLASMAISLLVAVAVFSLLSMKAGMGFSEVKLRVDKFNEIMFFGAMARSFHGSLADRDEPPAKGNG